MLCSVCFFWQYLPNIPVLIRGSNSGVTCAVTSAHITIILESLLKPGDDTLCDSKFLGYFQLESAVKTSAETWLNEQVPDLYHDGLNKSVLRSDKCLNRLGDYVGV
ncbi:hypothetical protein TNCV_597851 [Trichonephila clavipes]|nr:hypothetical protein TNCV_597851 [Trichonephila clavipes]